MRSKLPSCACCHRKLLRTDLAFDATAPNKLTVTFNLFEKFNCLMPHFTRVTQRSALGRGHFVIPTCPSHHSWRSHTVVPDAVVWGRVKVDQLFLLARHSSWWLFNSLLQYVVLKWYPCSFIVDLLQFGSHKGERRQPLPASYQITTPGDAMTFALSVQTRANNLFVINKFS